MAGGAFDAGSRVTAEHNPLISFISNLRQDADVIALMLEDFLKAFDEFIIHNLLQWLQDLTGINFTSWETAIDSLFMDALNLFLRGEIGNTAFDLVSFLINIVDLLSPLNLFASGGGLSPLNLVNSVISPTGLVAMLTSGLLDPFNIPGLDASKIVTGTLGQSIIQPLIDAVSLGFGGSSGLGFGGLQSFLGGLSFAGIGFNDLIALFPYAATGLTGASGLGAIFGDLTGLLGNPTAIGSGTPVLPGIGSIPLLGGLLSGGSLLTSLIPGLDASKIISGTFSAALMQPLIDAIATGFGGGTGLNFGSLTSLLSAIPGASQVITTLIGALSPGSLLTGTSGMGSVLTDLFHLIGQPTGMGTGSPTLPALSNIPLLSPLQSLVDQVIGGTNNPVSALVSYLQNLVSGFVSEDPSGTINGVNAVFGLAQNPTAGSLQVYVNGLLQRPADYSVSGSTVTLSTPPGSGESVHVIYQTGGSGAGSGFINSLVQAVTGSISTAGGGLAGLTAWFTDLTHLLGSPSSMGSGSPSLPGIGSIPLLGGLLSGSSILASLIPGLDASKIISGAFPQSMITGLSTLLSGFAGGSSIVSQLLALWPHAAGGLTGLTGLQSVYTDLMGLLGSPTALGSGAPVLPGISSIPVLGGLLSGGNILASIIPGLDASKIISGAFAQTMVTNLATQMNGFSGTSSIINQLLGQWPNQAGGLTGLAGLHSVYADLTGLLGNPTSLGSGSPGLPGVGSIPVLGGLLSGGQFLSSLIPGLDASKFVSGTLSSAFVPWAAPLDVLVSAWGGPASGNTAIDLGTYAQQLPNTVMQGLLGGANVGNTIQNFVDVGVQAINSSTATGNSLSVFQNAMNSLANYLGYKPGGTPAATSVAGVGTTNNNFITQMAAAKPTAAGIDLSTDAPYNLDVVLAPATVPTVTITDKASAGAFISTPHGGNKQSVRWLGYPSGGTMANLNGFYVNVWKYNPNTPNKMTPVHQSGNLSGSVGTGTTPVWNSYNLPSTFTAVQGDLYYVDISVYGTGTYNIAGYTNGLILTSGIPQSQGGGTWYGPDQTCHAEALSTAPKSGVGSNILANITFDNGADSGIIIATTTSIAASNFGVTVGGKAATRLGAVNVGTAGGPQVALWWMANPPDTKLTAGANSVILTSNVAGSWYGALNAVNIWGAADVAGIISQNVTGGNVSKQLTGAANQDWDQQWYVALASNATTHTPGGYPASPNGGVLVSASNIANTVPLTLGYSDMFEFATITATRTTGGASMIAVPVFTNRVMATGVPAPRGLPYNGVVNTGPYTSNAYYYQPSPWIGLSGVAGATTYNPVLTPIYSSQTMANPNNTFAWANFHDVLACGAGGGGKGGQPGYYPAFGGAGGNAGGWNYGTLTRAQMGTSNLTWTIGAPGLGSATSNNVGTNGGASSCSIPGYGVISGPGGAGASGNSAYGNNLGSPGAGAGSVSYNGQYYPGGPGGAAPSGYGSQPGGGGGGGNAGGYGNQNGGNGGAGIGYIYSYQ